MRNNFELSSALNHPTTSESEQTVTDEGVLLLENIWPPRSVKDLEIYLSKWGVFSHRRMLCSLIRVTNKSILWVND